MKNFISINDVDNIDSLVKKALAYKASPLMNAQLGTGKKIGLIFLNPSLRTRLSTQVAARNLGMEAVVFNAGTEGWALEFEDGAIMNGTTVEHIKDAAPILGNYFDILCVRSFPGLVDRDADYAETIINKFIGYAGVPVVSLESATLHPLQSFADVITITETKTKPKPKVVLSWAPHIKPLPQCVANSFSQWMTAWKEVDFMIAHPGGYALSAAFTKGARITHDQDEALAAADYVYVKNWSSFVNYGAMPGEHNDWVITNEKLSHTNNAKIMHCLPVRRNVELSDEVLDGPSSLVTQQAANRVWAAQAVLSEILHSIK
ncbi:MAG TPA: N-acetylornithine carbamoyltransferase [Ferruginibacter sp.]|nr:N-acetylornithine carbamoyltransferase [Ferruginibacter sp.]